MFFPMTICIKTNGLLYFRFVLLTCSSQRLIEAGLSGWPVLGQISEIWPHFILVGQKISFGLNWPHLKLLGLKKFVWPFSSWKNFSFQGKYYYSIFFGNHMQNFEINAMLNPWLWSRSSRYFGWLELKPELETFRWWSRIRAWNLGSVSTEIVCGASEDINHAIFFWFFGTNCSGTGAKSFWMLESEPKNFDVRSWSWSLKFEYQLHSPG